MAGCDRAGKAATRLPAASSPDASISSMRRRVGSASAEKGSAMPQYIVDLLYNKTEN